MNTFILSTGRVGSVSLSKALNFAENITVGHESLSRKIGEERLNYPDNHIELDNRLVWMLGRLDKKYGDQATYVHIKRNRDSLAASFNNRWHFPSGIITAYKEGVLMNREKEDIRFCYDLIDTVNANIDHFLKNKTKVIYMHLESLESDFKNLWSELGLTGDLDSAVKQLAIKYNKTKKKGLKDRLKDYLSS